MWWMPWQSEAGSEERDSLRKAPGGGKYPFDPEMSGYRTTYFKVGIESMNFIVLQGERGKLKHLSTLRKRIN